MRDILLVLDGTDKELYQSAVVRQGENRASRLLITLTEEFIGYRYVLVFKSNDNTSIISEELFPVDDVITYELSNALTIEAGSLRVELQAFDETETLIKTATTTLKVTRSIDSTSDVVPEDYVVWYTELMKIVDTLEGKNAEDTSIQDVGEYYVSDNVEGALAEAGLKIKGKYDDLPPVPLIMARVGNSAPTMTVFEGGIQQYTFDAVNDEVFGASEVTHQYKEGTNILPHLHWVNNGSEAVNKYVKWELEYTISNGMASFGDTVVLSEEVLIVSNLADRTHFITSFSPISGTGVHIGSYICWRLRRVPSVGLAPVSNPFGIAIGFHVEQDTFGSVLPTSK